MSSGLGRGLSELLSANLEASKAKGRHGQIGQDLVRRSLAAKHGTNPEEENFEIPESSGSAVESAPPLQSLQSPHSPQMMELQKHLTACEKELENAMQGVHAAFVLQASGQGKLTLSFHNLKELEAILQRLKF